MSVVKIAVVGSGPGGLSAAARAAERGLPHVLLESSAEIANTIARYQKGKHVMAEPSSLPLRSPLPFGPSSRENVLSQWEEALAKLPLEIRYNAEVAGIRRDDDGFTLQLKDDQTIRAENVVLAIGLQGNPRRLDAPGEFDGFVQYTLDDPEEYQRETIVVVGAGDAAIENALALADNNIVVIVNRRDEFARAKEGNLTAVLAAIQAGRVDCYYNSSVARIETAAAGARHPCTLILNTATGEAVVPCNRIIARLGAIPPRDFVESCGVVFPNQELNAVPVLSTKYESNVPGLYIVGALAGYPLIKQAMNQGYEVIEYILGEPLLPADHQLLADKFSVLGTDIDVDAQLQRIQQTIPLFAKVNTLQLREIILESELHKPVPGSIVFKRNDYTDTLFNVLDGSVAISAATAKFTLNKGSFFGEMGLVSGRRRSATVVAGPDCVLIETPRRIMRKLLASNADVKRLIDEAFILRALQSSFASDIPLDALQKVVSRAQLHYFKPRQVLFAEGDMGDRLHLVRSGSLTVARRVDGRDIVLSYVAAGQFVGEMGLLGNTRRNATVAAAVATETVSIDSEGFDSLLELQPGLRDRIQNEVRNRLESNAWMEASPDSGDVLSFLIEQGLGEATDVLLIDATLCIGCDNCERACAATHDGVSRLDREAGPTFANIHVPTSCRHCEHPHCMKDCPPDAIHRLSTGEVYIADNCIGCGNCERNCPYDVIQMAEAPPSPPPLWQWLLFGRGRAPGDEAPKKEHKAHGGPSPQKKAVKCDMCAGIAGGASCVRACPTGAAIRIGPDKFTQLIHLAE